MKSDKIIGSKKEKEDHVPAVLITDNEGNMFNYWGDKIGHKDDKPSFGLFFDDNGDMYDGAGRLIGNKNDEPKPMIEEEIILEQ